MKIKKKGNYLYAYATEPIPGTLFKEGDNIGHISIISGKFLGATACLKELNLALEAHYRKLSPKEFYTTVYPADSAGQDIRDDATWDGVLYYIGQIYQYIGVSDSIVRERLFEQLSKRLTVPYDSIYNLWLKH